MRVLFFLLLLQSGLPNGPEFSPEMCANTFENFTFTDQEMNGATNFNWQSLDPNLFIYGSGNSVTISVTAAGELPFSMQPINTCGSVSPSTFYVISSNCWEGFNFIAYPNAASEAFKIDLPGNFEDPELEIVMVDEFGEIRKKTNALITQNPSQLTIDVADLSEGWYFIRITGKSGHQQIKVSIDR